MSEPKDISQKTNLPVHVPTSQKLNLKKPNRVRPIAISLAGALILSAIGEQFGEQIGERHATKPVDTRNVTVVFRDYTGLLLNKDCGPAELRGSPLRPVVFCTISGPTYSPPTETKVLAAN